MKICRYMKKAFKVAVNAEARFLFLASRGFYNEMPDEEYLKKKFRIKFGRELNLENPKTFNEKLQWLKLYDRKPEYTQMVDKYEAKKYVAERIGEEYIIPTLGVWDRFEDIDFDVLPDQFVLKCTHDSGGLVICRDKDKLDKRAAQKGINKALKRNYFYPGREWPYKDVKPRIIAEKYMAGGEALTDYKFMCFNGKVGAIFVCSERFSKKGVKITPYDSEWNVMPFGRELHPKSDVPIDRPVNLELMLNLSESLAKGIPFVRIDFYEHEGKAYFGEITFFPESGFGKFSPREWDTRLGEWIQLSGEVN